MSDENGVNFLFSNIFDIFDMTRVDKNENISKTIPDTEKTSHVCQVTRIECVTHAKSALTNFKR